MSETLHPVREAAKQLGLSIWTLRKKAYEGDVVSVKIGAKLLIPESEITRLIQEGMRPPLVASDPTDKTRRLFLPMKNNLGPDSTGLAFRIEGATISSSAGPLETSRVVWDSDPVTVTADEAMQAETTPQGISALAEASDWLRETLADGGKPANEIFKMATADGISGKTLRRARQELGIKPVKLGMKSGWTWSLSPKMAKTAEGAQQNSLATFEDLGHLREPQQVEVEL